MQMQGHTISGNEITIIAYQDCDVTPMGWRKWYWGEVYIVMGGDIINIDDMTDRNKTHIMDQLPYL